jgi:acetyl-CoA carboxylase biotin carboxyl carrier protein
MTTSDMQTKNKQTVEQEHNSEEFVTIEQLRKLAYIFDQSDMVELAVKDSGSNARLVLRKATSRASAHNRPQPAAEQNTETHPTVPEQNYHTITATMVGIFHPWPGEQEKKPPIKVGDHIKKGQHIGIIQALNIANEIEAPVTGQVIEILVEDGQGVEYGQPLMTIDNCTGSKDIHE